MPVRWVARNLDSKTVSDIAPASWVLWTDTSEMYRGIGYRAGTKPPATGDLLVQSPYTDWYNLTWGLSPNADMPKWRWMYRARPEIRQGIDLMVILAVGRAFTVVCKDNKEVEEYANRLLNHLNLREVLQSAVSDMLVYGQAYFEKIRTNDDEKQAHEELELAPIEKRVEGHELEKPTLGRIWQPDDFDDSSTDGMADKISAYAKDTKSVDRWLGTKENQKVITKAFKEARASYFSFLARVDQKIRSRWKAAMKEVHDIPGTDPMRSDIDKPEAGELVELKPLDPLWMRINRDSFNNVLGFVQWGLTPIPQAIISEKLVFLRWMPKSWAFESAYGTSILMPVQRHVSLLIQAEEDMKVFWHQYAKPMLVVRGGTPEKPYPNSVLQGLQNKFAARQTNTDAVVPGDVVVEMLQSGTAKTAITFDVYAKYNREKIYETLGIPSVLMNLPGEITRATSDVTLQAFIAKERMIQDYVGEQVMKQAIEPECRRHFAGKIAPDQFPALQAVWPPILTEDRNKIADRVIKSTGRPIESVNEGRSELGLEPLQGPTDEPDKYDKIADVAQAGYGTQPSKMPEPSATQKDGPRGEEQEKLDRGTETGSTGS